MEATATANGVSTTSMEVIAKTTIRSNKVFPTVIHDPQGKLNSRKVRPNTSHPDHYVVCDSLTEETMSQCRLAAMFSSIANLQGWRMTDHADITDYREDFVQKLHYIYRKREGKQLQKHYDEFKQTYEKGPYPGPSLELMLSLAEDEAEIANVLVNIAKRTKRTYGYKLIEKEIDEYIFDSEQLLKGAQERFEALTIRKEIADNSMNN